MYLIQLCWHYKYSYAACHKIFLQSAIFTVWTLCHIQWNTLSSELEIINLDIFDFWKHHSLIINCLSLGLVLIMTNGQTVKMRTKRVVRHSRHSLCRDAVKSQRNIGSTEITDGMKQWPNIGFAAAWKNASDGLFQNQKKHWARLDFLAQIHFK